MIVIFKVWVGAVVGVTGNGFDYLGCFWVEAGKFSFFFSIFIVYFLLMSKKILPIEKSLLKTHYEIAKYWHPGKNGTLMPMDVTSGLDQIVWWKCDKDHEWKLKISTIVKRYKKGLLCCPICEKRKEIIESGRSFADINPELIKEWHPTKNGDLTPYEVFSTSHKKAWWKCSKDHEWQASIANRHYGNGCIYCAGQKSTKDYNLGILFPHLVKEWDTEKNGDLTPYDMLPFSSKKVWWKCLKKRHSWKTAISKRTELNRGCPYCVGQKVCKDNSLATMNPEIASEWHPTKNGNLTPNDVTFGSGKKVWWRCQNGHEWRTAIGNRTNGGYGCKKCYHESRKKKQKTQELDPYEIQNYLKSRDEFVVGVILFVGNIPKGFDDIKVYNMLSKYGKVTSVKMLYNKYDSHKGCGFFTMKDPKAAKKAIKALNGKILEDGKYPLQVRIAETKHRY